MVLYCYLTEYEEPWVVQNTECARDLDFLTLTSSIFLRLKAILSTNPAALKKFLALKVVKVDPNKKTVFDASLDLCHFRVQK